MEKKLYNHPVILLMLFCFAVSASSAYDDYDFFNFGRKNDCREDEFKCADGTCIPESKRCNFISDCPPPYDATDENGCVMAECCFEDGDLCGWEVQTSEGEGSLAWKSVKAEERPDELAPPIDHTFGTKSGYYLLALSQGEVKTDAITKLKPSAPFGRTAEKCQLTFWYWLSGNHPGSIHVTRGKIEEEAMDIWMADGNEGDEWKFATMTIGQLNQHNLTIEAHRGSVYNGSAALDDVLFKECQTPFQPAGNKTCEEMGYYGCKDGSCVSETVVCDYEFDCEDFTDESPLTCRNYKFRCDFEIGFCKDWQQDIDDNTNWIILEASAEIQGTTPEVDHTGGTFEGHYIILNSGIAAENVTAVGRIHSPVLLDSGKDCTLRYWYQFTGDVSSTLKIYARVSYYDDGMKLVAEHFKVPPGEWNKETVSFSEFVSHKPYQVVIEGSATTFGMGNIAIDDLSMTVTCEVSHDQTLPGEDTLSTPVPVCLPGQLVCNNGDCYFPSDVCNFMNDCSDGTDENDCAKSCSFENEGNLCGWYENEASSIHWKIQGFPAEAPGPEKDHNDDATTHDLAVIKDDESKGQQAILESYTFSGANESCVMEAWYYMANAGDEKSSLNLYLSDEQETKNIWSASKLSSWEKLSVAISSEMNFILIFQAIMGQGKAYTALDDIEFKDCAVHTKKCTRTEFQCIEDENCIPFFLVCDEHPDCHDGTDEEMCFIKKIKGDCHFDHEDWLHLCDWEQLDDDDFDWLRANATNKTIIGPSDDHTFGEGGYYIYVEGSNEPGKVASVSPNYLYPPSSGVCYIRYWYYMSDRSEDFFNIGALNVYLEDEEYARRILSSHKTSKPSVWMENILLVTSDTNFRVIFEAETGDPEHTYIALDDVSFTLECVLGISPINETCLYHEFECLSGECIPQRLLCNAYEDCEDGSDEEFCPCRETEFDCKNNIGTCLPAALLCDGINDCNNGYDEKFCPESTPCKSGSIYCSDLGLEDPCMEAGTSCDGDEQCLTYRADESLCGICFDNYCLHDSKCVVEKNNTPSCQCSNGFKGYRCTENDEEGGGGGGGLSGGAITGIVVGCLAFVILVAGGIYYYIQKKKLSDSSGYSLNPMQ